MSTILEALKKAQDNRAEKRLGERIIVSPPPSRPARRVFTMVLALCLIVLTAAAAFHFVSTEWWREAKAVMPPVKVHSETGEDEVAGSPAPVREASVSEPVLPDLDFSGVMHDGGEPVALVNGRTLTAGQEIEGVTIVSIGLNGVKVRYKGRDYTIDLSSR